jgi:hypothetical protein
LLPPAPAFSATGTGNPATNLASFNVFLRVFATPIGRRIHQNHRPQPKSSQNPQPFQ